MGLKENLINYSKRYNKVGSVFNKVLIVIFVLCAAVMVMYSLDPQRFQSQVVQTDNVPTGVYIDCPRTQTGSLENLTISNINIVDKISVIDYTTDVLKGPNQKNLIPPVTKPEFSTYTELGSCFPDDQMVITVTTDNITKVYPLAILDYHIVINDIIGNTPVAVVYTPTSGIINVFKTLLKTNHVILGHTGSLYKNTDLLVDFSTDTLWSAKTGEALVGVMTGGKLEKINFRLMNYGKAKTEYTLGKIMTFSTGFRRDYGIDPFKEFKNNNVIPQQTSNQSTLLNLKETVVGFVYNNQNYAISINKIKDQTPYSAIIGADKLTSTYSKGEYILTLISGNVTSKLNFEFMYWYVWYDYYPDTIVL